MKGEMVRKIVRQARVEFGVTPTDESIKNLDARLAKTLKRTLQLIAELTTQKKLVPCSRCVKAGVSMGYVARYDIEWGMTFEDCPECDGWTVVHADV